MTVPLRHRLIAVVIFACVQWTVSTLAEGPAINAAKESVSLDDKAPDNLPDISGEWSRGQNGAYGKAVIRRSATDPAVFLVEDFYAKRAKQPSRASEVKWIAGAQQFEGDIVDQDGTSGGRMTLMPDAGNKTMRFNWLYNDEARQKMLELNLSDEDIKAVANQVWTRISPPSTIADRIEKDPEILVLKNKLKKKQEMLGILAKSAPQFAQVEMEIVNLTVALEVKRSALRTRMQEELQRIASAPPVTATIDDPEIVRLQIDALEKDLKARVAHLAKLPTTAPKFQEFENEIVRVKSQLDAKRAALKLAIRRDPPAQVAPQRQVAVTPEAQQLLDRLQAQESAAASEAGLIRTLQANGNTAENKTALAEHQRKLTSLLSTAFDLKIQLEELQVQELRSRLSRIERQIGQRKQLRDKIISRRAAELIEDGALKWSQGANGSNSPNVGVSQDDSAAEGATQAGPAAGSSEVLEGQTDAISTRKSTGAGSNARALALSAIQPAAVLPSPEDLREQVAPHLKQVAAKQERARELEAIYYKDRSRAAELQSALDDLASARRELRSALSAIERLIGEHETECREAQSLAVALTQQKVMKIEQLAKGQGTEAEVKAAIEATKRAVDAVNSIAARYETYATVLNELSPRGIEDDKNQISNPPDVPPPGYDPHIALTFLEETTGLKLEFMKFEGLNLPFKAALRIREATDQYQAGDLLVLLNRHRFDSLDQAARALWEANNKASSAGDSVFLKGGLAGQAVKVRFHRHRNYDCLHPSRVDAAGGVILRFEVRMQGDQLEEVATAYVDGVCVSLEGLAVLALPAKSIVTNERIAVYSPVQGTARVVGSDDKRGLTLVKVEAPERRLFPWVKCRSALPSTGQRLTALWRQANDGFTRQPVTVFAIGQSYLAPREGHDAFALDPTNEFRASGTALMSLDNELQGIQLTIASDLHEACAPALHIQKLLDDYYSNYKPDERHAE
jgi:hypothetical protein